MSGKSTGEVCAVNTMSYFSSCIVSYIIVTYPLFLVRFVDIDVGAGLRNIL